MATYSNRDRPVQRATASGSVAALTVPVDFSVCRVWRFEATIVSAGASDLVLRPNGSTATTYTYNRIINGTYSTASGDWIIAAIGAAAQVTRIVGKVISPSPASSNRKTLFCEAIRDADQAQETQGDWSAGETITSLEFRSTTGSLIGAGSQISAWPENVNLTSS